MPSRAKDRVAPHLMAKVRPGVAGEGRVHGGQGAKIETPLLGPRGGDLAIPGKVGEVGQSFSPLLFRKGRWSSLTIPASACKLSPKKPGFARHPDTAGLGDWGAPWRSSCWSGCLP